MPTVGYARAFPLDAATILGVTPGAGGLAVLDDANAGAIRTTLSLGAVALLSQVARQYVFFDAAAQVWTNMPAATTEVFGTTNRRIYADLRGCTTARLISIQSVAGAAGAKLGVQYSTNDGSSWKFLDDTVDGDLGAVTPQVAIGGIGSVTSAYMTLAANAAAVVMLRIVGDDGDGVVDPQFTFIALEVR